MSGAPLSNKWAAPGGWTVEHTKLSLVTYPKRDSDPAAGDAVKAEAKAPGARDGEYLLVRRYGKVVKFVTCAAPGPGDPDPEESRANAVRDALARLGLDVAELEPVEA